MEGLKPCPFCGSSIVGHLEVSTNPSDRLGVVGCGVCGCQGPCLYDSRQAFAARWNERADPPRPSAVCGIHPGDVYGPDDAPPPISPPLSPGEVAALKVEVDRLGTRRG